jgi:choline monooxygenase
MAVDLLHQRDQVAALLAGGATLPAEWYTSPEILDRERRAIFARTWQYAGHVAMLPEVGDFFTFTAGHIPVVVVRDQDGALRAFVNVCRHRGHQVVLEEAGNKKAFQCHYHAWTYRVDGCLAAAPRADREPGFEKERFPLFPMRVQTWGPLIFVNADPDAAPLAETLGELPDLLADWGYDLAAYRYRGADEMTVPSNWKVYVENAIECYHCPTAHPSFSARVEVDPEVYTLKADHHLISHISWLKERVRQSGPQQPQPGERPDFNFFYIWPNMMLNVYPQRFTMRRFYPIDPDRTLRVAHGYYAAGMSEAEIREIEVSAAQDPTLAEDLALVERVQQGLKSGLLPHGQLLMNSEFLLHHVQELVLEALTAEPSQP